MLYLYQDTISFQASGEVEQIWARQNKKFLALFIGLNVYWGHRASFSDEQKAFRDVRWVRKGFEGEVRFQ